MRQVAVAAVVCSENSGVCQIFQRRNDGHGRVALQVTYPIDVIVRVRSTCGGMQINLNRFVGKSYSIVKDKDANGKDKDTATHIR